MLLKGYSFGVVYAMACLILSLVLYKLGIPKKYTRKVVHILVGFEWVILHHFMGASIHFLVVCIMFLVILTVAYKGRLMPMIASDSDNAPGTVYYALAMTGAALVCLFLPGAMLPFGIGVMCTSLGDGMAGVIGQVFSKRNPRIFGNKTLFGSLTNVLVSALATFIICSVYSVEIGIFACVVIGVLSAELELITPYGFDNVSVTWGTMALAYCFMNFSGIWNYVVPILLTPVIIIFVLSKKALTHDGIVAAIILDIAITLAFGNSGFIILCIFFFGSVLIDKIKKKSKSREEETAKGDCRDYMQVLANGLAAFVVSVAYFITKKDVFILAFTAAMAEAFADTAASGIGAFSQKTYDPFKRKVCQRGISGGISLLGTSASFLAALTVGVTAYLLGFTAHGWIGVGIIVAAAFIGAIFDSFLGSVVQVKFKCTVCTAETEREEHCGKATVKCSGLAMIDNDMVNLISSAFSAVVAILLTLLI